MPLVTKLPLRQNRDMAKNSRVHDASLQVQHSQDIDFDEFDEFKDDECVDSDMEGSILHQAMSSKVVRAPAVPARSQKRASKLLQELMMDLEEMNMSKEVEMEKKAAAEEDPHELYLSSEEEGSLSDDCSESLLDFEPTEEGELVAEERAQSSRASSRKSQEVTARVISFTLVRPQIVQIHPTSAPSSAIEFQSSRNSSIHSARSTSSRSASPSRPTPRRPAALTLYPSSLRRSSSPSTTTLSKVSSSTSYIPPSTSIPAVQQPKLRKSSRMADLAQLVTKSLHQTNTSYNSQPSNHPFLSTDPYPSPSSTTTDRPITPQTPTTPTRLAAEAFKKGISRSLSRARKPSMQKLNSAFSSHRNSSALNLSSPESSDSSPVKQQRRKSLAFPSTPLPEEEIPETPTMENGLAKYEDLMRTAIRSPPQKSGGSPLRSSRMSVFGGLGMGKSLRAV